MDKETIQKMNDAKERYGSNFKGFTSMKLLKSEKKAEDILKKMEQIDAELPKCPECKEPMRYERCLNCEKIAGNKIKAEKEKKDRELFDIERLGGEKAYHRFTMDRVIQKRLIEECSAYPKTNLFIYGDTGSGKSHLGTAHIRGHYLGHVYKPMQIFRLCRFLGSPKLEQEAIDRFINMERLMIDDLGLNELTPKAHDTLYEIIDGRDMRMKTGLIITANLMYAELAAQFKNDRITSRLNGMCRVILMQDPIDHREEQEIL